MQELTTNGIPFTRIKGDANGNPRYVVHFIYFLKTDERDYNLAVRRAKQLGGKKYNAKWYGGGIVFQSYNIDELAKDIKELTQ